MTEKPADTAVKGAEKASPVPVEQMWKPVARLRGEMARLFDDFFAGFPSFGRVRRGFEMEPLGRLESMFAGSVPAVDLRDRGKEYAITAELPGMDEKDVEVKLVNNVLTVKGDKKEESEEKKAGYYLSERRFGAFERSFRLPEDIDLDKIGARFEKGVLTINLPKSEGAAKKEGNIAIKKM